MQLSSLLYGGLIILQIIAMNMLFTDYARDYHKKFEEKRLQIAVNYAVDAAAEKMRTTSDHLGQDYTDITQFHVDPKVAVDTFSAIMAKNYSVPLSAETSQSILLDYVPVFMVVTYDGYYIMDKEKINSSGVENMVFSPKLPYTHLHTEVNGTTSMYSYTLSSTSALKVTSTGGVFKEENPPLNKEQQSDLINNKISDVLNEYLAKNANGDRRGMIYIPSEMTSLRATNAVKDTTVFAYIDNFDLSGYGLNLQSFGIGGSDIKQNRTIAGFEMMVNGVLEKFYTYSDELPGGVTIAETFDTKEEAAQNGYYYYME